MARGRLILRSLGSSRKYADMRARAGKLGEFAQSLYPLLVASTDDYGRQAGDAFTVKHAVFPTSPRTEVEFDAALDAMHRVGLVVRYEVDGTQILQIVEFEKGQPNLHKRSASTFPEFSGNLPEIPPQSNLTELKRTEPNPTARRAGESGFEEFWQAYPKKRSKADAEKAWRKLAPSPELSQRILGAVAAQRTSPEWQKDGGQFVPFPATWINGKRWEDTIGVDLAGPKVETIDWWAECKEIHGGACEERLRHHHQMAIDKLRAS